MKPLLTRATLALALGATALTASVPASAQRYGGGHRGHDNSGVAIVAGIAGLAIGAAIASSGNHRRDGYYEQGYDNGPGYDQYRYEQYPQVYDNGYYQQGYYQQGYYADRGYYRDDRGRHHHRDHGDYDRGDRGYGRYER